MITTDFEVLDLVNKTKIFYFNERVRIDEAVNFIKGFPNPVRLSDKAILIYNDSDKDLEGNSLEINDAASQILQDYKGSAKIVKGNALILMNQELWDWVD